MLTRSPPSVTCRPSTALSSASASVVPDAADAVMCCSKRCCARCSCVSAKSSEFTTATASWSARICSVRTSSCLEGIWLIALHIHHADDAVADAQGHGRLRTGLRQEGIGMVRGIAGGVVDDQRFPAAGRVAHDRPRTHAQLVALPFHLGAGLAAGLADDGEFPSQHRPEIRPRAGTRIFRADSGQFSPTTRRDPVTC